MPGSRSSRSPSERSPTRATVMTLGLLPWLKELAANHKVRWGKGYTDPSGAGPDAVDLVFRSRWLLKGRCPFCSGTLEGHSLAWVGACNFNGPNPRNGFLDEIIAREWHRVVDPEFYRLRSMDMMCCDLLRCSVGVGLVVWADVDILGPHEFSIIRTELLKEDEVREIEHVASLRWMEF